MIAGVMMTAKSTGRKNKIIGTVNLGGNPAAFFSASSILVSRLYLANPAQGGAERRALSVLSSRGAPPAVAGSRVWRTRRCSTGWPPV